MVQVLQLAPVQNLPGVGGFQRDGLAAARDDYIVGIGHPVGLVGVLGIEGTVFSFGLLVAHTSIDAHAFRHEEGVATRIVVLSRYRTVGIVGALAHEDLELQVLHLAGAVALLLADGSGVIYCDGLFAIQLAGILYVEQGIIELLQGEGKRASFHIVLVCHDVVDVFVHVFGLHYKQAGDELGFIRHDHQRAVEGACADFNKVLVRGSDVVALPIQVVGRARVACQVVGFQRRIVEVLFRCDRLVYGAQFVVGLGIHARTGQYRVAVQVVIGVVCQVEAHALGVFGVYRNVVHARRAQVLDGTVGEGIVDRSLCLGRGGVRVCLSAHVGRIVACVLPHHAAVYTQVVVEPQSAAGIMGLVLYNGAGVQVGKAYNVLPLRRFEAGIAVLLHIDSTAPFCRIVLHYAAAHQSSFFQEESTAAIGSLIVLQDAVTHVGKVRHDGRSAVTICVLFAVFLASHHNLARGITVFNEESVQYGSCLNV